MAEKTFEEIVSSEKERLDEILKKEGTVTGEVFHTTYEYIKKKKGEVGLDDFAQKAKEMGRELDLRQIDYTAWHPVGLRAYSFLVMISAFDGWGREELIDCGYNAPKTSLVMKILIRYFISLRAILNRAPVVWKKHYDIGNVSVPEVNEEKKFAIIRIENFDVSPLFCIFYLGYFQAVAEFSTEEGVSIEKTKCIYDGGDYHEYTLRWK